MITAMPTATRPIERFEQIDVARPIRVRWKDFSAVEPLEIDIQQFWRPMGNSQTDQIAAQDRKISFSAILDIIRLVVGNKIREQRNQRQKTNELGRASRREREK